MGIMSCEVTVNSALVTINHCPSRKYRVRFLCVAFLSTNQYITLL